MVNILSEIPFDPSGFEKAQALIKSLNNPNRLLILCLLCYREATVTEMAEAAGLSMSAVSQHLSIMKDAGFITGSKESQTVTYRLVSDDVRRLIETLKDLYCPED